MTLEEAGIVVGSRVRMLSTTRYADASSNPRDCDGTVRTADYDHAHVDWDNGTSNGSYTAVDIGLAEPAVKNNYSIF